MGAQMTVEKSEPAFLPELPGIDRKDGLARAMNDEALYASILLEFLLRYRSAPRELREARDSKDIERIRFLAHKLKGVTGTIGAQGTFTAAEALESTLPDSAQPAIDDDAFENFLGQLEWLLSSLAAAEQVLERMEGTGDSPAIDNLAPPSSQLSELAALLRASDMAAIPLFESLRPTFSHAIDPIMLERIDLAIKDLQFEEAARLVEVITRLGKGEGDAS